jgi:hypothetical protein
VLSREEMTRRRDAMECRLYGELPPEAHVGSRWDPPVRFWSDATLCYRVFGGNPPHAPYIYGWTLRFGEGSLPEERATLKRLGFSFSGGRWYKRDEG